MQEFRKLIITLIVLMITLIVLIFLGVFLVGWVRRPVVEENVTEITSRAVLERVTDSYFLVTKAIYINEETEIVIDDGSAWSNFFWGDKINASALVKVHVGVDVENLTEDDIKIDHNNKTITVSLPDAEILDATIDGDIEVNTEKGLFRKITSDDKRDYNLAINSITTESKESVIESGDMFEQAQSDAYKLIELIVDDFGYTVVVSQSSESDQ